ncbi:ATP-binding cassette domain-containing protein [Kiloniella sp. b19]|uniref:ATP-binding cassette domain-containing protein n=1 Tax=Kiloniella sp. GXU_MW_B19 TaxID=3141326 RepID=UPI0031D4FE2A
MSHPDHTSAVCPLVLDQVQILKRDEHGVFCPLFPPLERSITPGEILTVMGPSGCGKSTLLNWISGWLKPEFKTSGDIRLGDCSLQKLAPEKRNLGLLLQDPLLFPHMTVGQNLAFGIPQSTKSRTERKDRVRAALAEAGLEGFENRHPDTLSGGQKARVALMRTLLSKPKALLLDEPFSKLDENLRDRVRHFVFEHARSESLPTLLVTHDQADAALASRYNSSPETAIVHLTPP